MEEILELKECLLNHEYDRAYAIVEELEAMGRQDKREHPILAKIEVYIRE